MSKTTGLTFYYSPHSSASPVHWTLEELGIPYEKVKLDLKAGDAKKADFLQLNPNGKVPLLVHDGVTIFESAAIQMYLGEMFGVEKGLYPPPGPRRGEVMKWIVWTNVSLGDAVSRYARNTTDWAPVEERNEKAGASAKKEIDGLLKIVEDTLSGRQYLTGDQITLADMHLASWFDYLRMMRIDISGYPKVTEWVTRCTSRPKYGTAD